MPLFGSPPLDDPAVISCGRIVPAIPPTSQVPSGRFGKVFIRLPKPPTSAPTPTAGTTAPATGASPAPGVPAGDLAAPGAQPGTPLLGGPAAAIPPAARATTRLQSGAIRLVDYSSAFLSTTVASPLPANYRSALANP